MAMVSTTSVHTSKRMGRWERRGEGERREVAMRRVRQKSTAAGDERR